MLATQIEVSDGTLNTINVGIEFFNPSDISVSIDQSGTPLVEGVDYQWSANTTVQFLNTTNTPGGLVPAGVQAILRRNTKTDEMFNIYDGGAPFSRLTLDENFEQLLFLSQEYSEGLGLDGLRNNLSMNGYLITELGDGIEQDDAANKGQVDGAEARAKDYADNAVAGVAGGYGYFQQEGVGAADRTFQEKLREQEITIEDYLPDVVYVEAPYGQAEVNAATIVDDALEIAMITAAIQGRKVGLRGKVYRCERTFAPVSLSHISGVGCGQWLATMHPEIAGGVYKPNMNGSILLFTGNGAKTHKLLGVTDCRTSGGVVANDNIKNPGYDDKYKMFSAYNEDANFTTGAAATPKSFSAAVKLARGVHGVTLEGFRIMKSFKGVEGYHTAEIGYGDDWDFGLLIDNATANITVDVQVAGYWQEAGRMGRVGVVGSEGSSETASIEDNLFLRCTFQGLSGTEIRGQDSHRVIGRGADYIDLPWAANHPFDPVLLGGRVRSISGSSFTFTGTAVVGGNLRLTGVRPSPATLSLSTGIIPNMMANGMAKWIDAYCSWTGMDHQSGHRVTASEMGAFRKTRPSSAFNMTGYTLRGFSCPGTKITTQDDVAYHIHWATDVLLGPKFEVESKDANGLGLGVRLIGSPSESTNTRVPNPSGQLFRFVEDTMRDSADADHRPVGGLTPPRFPLGNGYLAYNTGTIKSIHDALDNGRFIRPPVAGSAGVKRSDGGLAGYYDDLAGHFRFAKHVRLDTDSILNSSGASKITTTGTSIGLRGDVMTVNSADGVTTHLRVDATSWVPQSTDNAVDIGGPVHRMRTVYAGTGSINTSDATHKTPIRTFTASEVAVAQALLLEVGMYQFLDAVAEKGDAARWHVGMTVQRAIEIFEAHGLDPFRNAFVCFDKWDTEYESWDAVYETVPAVIDPETGIELVQETQVLVQEAGTRLVHEAGELYSFRNDQLALAMLAGVAATQQALEARIKALEDK